MRRRRSMTRRTGTITWQSKEKCTTTATAMVAATRMSLSTSSKAKYTGTEARGKRVDGPVLQRTRLMPDSYETGR